MDTATAPTKAITSQQRWFFNCSACGAFKVVDVNVYEDGSAERFDQEEHFQAWGPGVLRSSIPQTWFTLSRRSTSLAAEAVCLCGAKVEPKVLNGRRKIAHVCDSACTHARGEDCICSCGGANHGIAWRGHPTWFIEFKEGSKKAVAVEATPEMAAAAAARRAELAAAREQRAQERKAAKVAGLLAGYRVQAADVADFLVPYVGGNINDEFLTSVANQLSRNGTLSSAQTVAVRKVMARKAERAQETQQRQTARAEADADRAARLAVASPLEAGRRPVTGTVVSVKWVEMEGILDGIHDPECGCGDRYCRHQGVLKMTFELEDGNRLFLALPRTINGEGGYGRLGSDEPDAEWWTRSVETAEDMRARRGLRLTLTVTVQPSAKDPHFGFGSNPRSVRVLDTPAPRVVNRS
ncbi:MAG TPA: hypothetical protein VH208_02560 [Myxococcaceae bacterium]|jgi:hypothetical protein|nr:hypothetical protein [Myxococcaceae bacterium]